MKRLHLLALIVVVAATVTACTKKPAATPAPPPAPSSGSGSATSRTTGAPSTVGREVPPAPVVIPPDPTVTSGGDPLASAAVIDINRDSPLKAVFFAYDSDTLDDAARGTMAANAEILKKYGTWVVTVEGHCDERGTAEYNLALGDRRALAVKNYMVSLGIAADRLKTVSYGSEFPFVPGHDEDSWALNRRAHFMLTAKQ